MPRPSWERGCAWGSRAWQRCPPSLTPLPGRASGPRSAAPAVSPGVSLVALPLAFGVFGSASAALADVAFVAGLALASASAFAALAVSLAASSASLAAWPTAASSSRWRSVLASSWAFSAVFAALLPPNVMSLMRRTVSSWRWPFLTRLRALGRYLNEISFSPRVCRTTSALTSAPATSGRPIDESAPSPTSRTRSRVIVLPGSTSSSSTSSSVPTSTRYCFPPVSMTAYMDPQGLRAGGRARPPRRRTGSCARQCRVADRGLYVSLREPVNRRRRGQHLNLSATVCGKSSRVRQADATDRHAKVELPRQRPHGGRHGPVARTRACWRRGDQHQAPT